MRRGTTFKRTVGDVLQLERKMITRCHLLTLDRGRCVGCELCTAVCPQEAIELKRGVLEAGKLVQRPTVDIDPAKCNFCGECVVVCPVNALSLLEDGKPQVPVLQYEVFPVLTRRISVTQDKLPADKAKASEDCCPTHVISVQVKRKARKPVAVEAVHVDESNCIYCKQCEAVAPEAFEVTHPFEGLIRLDTSLCRAGCQACADICPSHALFMQGGKLVLDDQFCLYCGACLNVCPVPAEGAPEVLGVSAGASREALLVRRHRVRHAPIKSGAWVAAVEKLTSKEMAAEELALKSQAKRRSVMNYLPGVGEKQ